jgi:hypothetical protein
MNVYQTDRKSHNIQFEENFMKLVVYLSLILTATQAYGVKYDRDVQFAEFHCGNQEFKVDIFEELNSEYDVIRATATITNSQGSVVDQGLVSVSGSQIETNTGRPPQYMKVWQNERFSVQGLFTPALPSRNFQATLLVPSEGISTNLTCVF